MVVTKEDDESRRVETPIIEMTSTCSAAYKNHISSPESKNRSVFELTEAGEYREIVDNLQFQLDGIFSKASPSLRQLSASRLLGICMASKSIISTFRANGIAPTLMRTVGLICGEGDPFIQFSLLFLAFLLCRNENGGITDRTNLPINVFIGIIQATSTSQSMYPSSLKSDDETSPLLVDRHVVRPTDDAPHVAPLSPSPSALVLASSSASSFSRKRKFGKSTKIPVQDQDKVDGTLMGLDITGECNRLLVKCPALFDMLVGPAAMVGSVPFYDLTSVNRLLALTLVSRYMVSKIQTTTNEQVRGSSMPGDDDEDANGDPSATSKLNRSAGATGCVALQEYQMAMRASLSASCCYRGNESALDVVVADCVDAMEKAIDHTRRLSKPYSPSLMSSLLNYLNFIEAVCFRSPENQVWCVLITT